MNATNFIRTIENIEVPVPGRWPISLGQTVNVDRTHGRQMRRTTGQITDGALVFDEEFGESTLSFTIGKWSPDLGEPPLRFRGRLARVDDRGVWQFAGTLTSAGESSDAIIDVFYRGVYNRGAKPVAWVTLQANIETARHVGHRRVRLAWIADLNALAPSAARLTDLV
jgi:hypothetical protein